MKGLTMLGHSKKYNYKIAQYKSDIPKPRRGEVVIVPLDNRLLEIPPYIQSSNLPPWWRSLPKSKFSLRRCQGTYDYVTAGIIIPLWADLTVRPNMQGTNFEYKMNNYGDNFNFRVENFAAESAKGCPISSSNKIPTGDYPKILSPYRFYTSKGVSMLSLPVYHEPNPNYTIMPGMVHTDFYNQIHVVINVLTDKEFTIPAGTPIQHLIPFHRSYNFKKIVWGNDSMARFIQGTGMGLGSLSVPDESHVYRKHEMALNSEALAEIEMPFYKKLIRKIK